MKQPLFARSALCQFATLGLLVLAPAAAVASPFVGAWRVDLDATQLSGGPVVISLSDGVLQCSACEPSFSVSADGKTHPAPAGAPYESACATVTGEDSASLVLQREGHDVFVGQFSVGAGGSTLKESFTEHFAETQTRGVIEFKRHDAAPVSGSRIVGSWDPQRIGSLSEEAANLQIEDLEQGLRVHWGDGRGFSAYFDLAEHPATGFAGNSRVLVTRLTPASFQVNRTENAQLADVSRFTVSADGQQLTIVSANWKTHRRTVWHLRRIS